MTAIVKTFTATCSEECQEGPRFVPLQISQQITSESSINLSLNQPLDLTESFFLHTLALPNLPSLQIPQIHNTHSRLTTSLVAHIIFEVESTY